VYGIYCEHFWYHNDSRQFRCHPWLMWRQHKRNRISVVTANGTETKTTDLNPSLPYIIHRKHKVYSWRFFYVHWFPVYIQSRIPSHNSSTSTPTISWRDIPESSGNFGNPRHYHSAGIKKPK
jgi:hypothetical protein